MEKVYMVVNPGANGAGNHSLSNVISNPNSGPNISNDLLDLDDLIPKELREAVNTKEEAEEEAKESPHQQSKPPKVVKVTSSEPKEVKVETKKEVPENLDDLDLDLSEESVDKLLEGDSSAVDKKEVEVIDEVPFWHEDKTYKEILSKTLHTGMNQEKLDKLLQEVADRKVLEQGKHVQGIEDENESLKGNNELLANEVKRLKVVERASAFDSLEETQEKFRKPMNDIANSLKRIFDMEGAPVDINALLNAKDRSVFTEMIKNVDLDEQTLSEVTNYWKNYKDLAYKYFQERNSANEDLRKHLKSNISDDEAHTFLKSSLMELTKDEKYNYLKKGIQEGLANHKDAQNVIGIGKNNFYSLIKAISNPLDHSKNATWLSQLAKYTIDAAHNAHIADQYGALQEKVGKQTMLLKKVVSSYKTLLDSAKGITSGAKGVSAGGIGLNGSSRKESKEDLEVAQEFNDFLSGKKKIDDLMPII